MPHTLHKAGAYPRFFPVRRQNPRLPSKGTFLHYSPDPEKRNGLIHQQQTIFCYIGTIRKRQKIQNLKKTVMEPGSPLQ